MGTLPGRVAEVPLTLPEAINWCPDPTAKILGVKGESISGPLRRKTANPQQTGRRLVDRARANRAGLLDRRNTPEGVSER